MSKYKVIDNFLDVEDLNNLKKVYDHMLFPWFMCDTVTKHEEKQDELFYLIHVLYGEDKPNSSYFDTMMRPFVKNQFWNSLLRVKLNNYPNQNRFTEHTPHTDFPFKHKGALFCLNTCNGYTKMYDGKKINSVENRMIFFDPTKSHASTNTTDQNKRVNINFNYF